MFSARGGFEYQLISINGGAYLNIISSSKEATPAKTVGGNTYVGCTSNTSNSDLVLLKFDSNANIVWQRSLTGSSTQENISDVAVDSSENIYVVGVTNTVGTIDDYIAKYDSNGNLQWQRTLGTSSIDSYKCITANASTIVVGGTSSNLSTNQATISVYGNSGGLTYQKYANSGTSYQTVGVGVDSSNATYSLNRSGNIANGEVYKTTLIKYNSSFLSFTLGRQLTAASGNIVPTSMYIEGSNIYIGSQLPDISVGHIAKYNNSGNLLWQKQSSNITIDNVTSDGTGNIFTIGGITGNSSLSSIQKLDSSGNIVWQKSITNSSANLVITNVSWANNYVYATGYNYPTRSTIVLKIPDNGNTVGSFGTYTIDNTAFTNSNGNASNASVTVTISTTSFTNSAGTLSNASSSLTSTIIAI